MSVQNLTLVFYVVASIMFVSVLLVKKAFIILIARCLFLGCIVVHFILLFMLGSYLHQIPLTSTAQALNMMIFIAALIFIPIIFNARTYILGVFFLPFAAFVLSWILPNIGFYQTSPIKFHTYWYPLHTFSVITGEAMFVVAAVTSTVYIIHERIIKKGDFHSPVSSLPALTLLDRFLYISVLIGFIGITTGMIAGTLWAQSLKLSLNSIAPKIIAGGVVWTIFAICLHQRVAMGWRGRRTAITALIGFFSMLILLFAINWIFPYAHGIRLLP